MFRDIPNLCDSNDGHYFIKLVFTTEEVLAYCNRFNEDNYPELPAWDRGYLYSLNNPTEKKPLDVYDRIWLNGIALFVYNNYPDFIQPEEFLNLKFKACAEELSDE